MCDCLQSAVVFADRYSGNRFQNLGIAQCNWNIKPTSLAPEMPTGYKEYPVMHNVSNRKCARVLRPDRCFTYGRVLTKLCVFDPKGSNLGPELRLKEGGNEQFGLGLQNGMEKFDELELGFVSEHEASDNMRTLDSLRREDHRNDEFGRLDFDKPFESESKGKDLNAEDLMSIEYDGKNDNLEDEELSQSKPKAKHNLSRSSKQLLKRSNILAKQVIGIESACSLGFISQLWVDTSTWSVLEVEVRPNLLSSESGRLRLEDIQKIGDVVLVQEENCMLSEFRTIGLETLVGYSVVTSGGSFLGKVRGYTFNINSGILDSIELDAFGYSIIPSSLVSTYALFSEDVLEVVSDIIIVHEAAASRIQRLTKGFLGTKNADTSRSLKYRDMKEKCAPPVKDRKLKQKSSKIKFYPRTTHLGNDFELPMDYM